MMISLALIVIKVYLDLRYENSICFFFLTNLPVESRMESKKKCIDGR